MSRILVFMVAILEVSSGRHLDEGNLQYNCVDNAKVAVALSRSHDAFLGGHKIAYIVVIDQERFVLKTSHMKENYVRIHNLKQDHKRYAQLFADKRYNPSSYISEYNFLNSHRGPWFPLLKGYCHNENFTWNLFEYARPLTSGFDLNPSLEQSVHMAISALQPHKQYKWFPGDDYGLKQFAYTPDWRIYMVDIHSSHRISETKKLQKNHDAVQHVKCVRDSDCMEYVQQIAEKTWRHCECDTFTCVSGLCTYSKQFLE